MIIELPIRWGDDFNYVVEAELLFDLAPQHAAVATWAVHKGALDWRVTNVETGLHLSLSSRGTKSEAIKAAKAELANLPTSRLSARIDAHGEFQP